MAHSEWNDPKNIGPKTVDVDKLRAIWAIRKTIAMIEAYDEDADANAGDVLEDIRALCADMLLHIERPKVAAVREPQTMFTCDQCGATFDDGIDAGHHEATHEVAAMREP
jgi:hypothetical protein